MLERKKNQFSTNITKTQKRKFAFTSNKLTTKINFVKIKTSNLGVFMKKEVKKAVAKKATKPAAKPAKKVVAKAKK